MASIQTVSIVCLPLLLGACANGSANSFTQAPIYFSDGAGGLNDGGLAAPSMPGSAASAGVLTSNGNVMMPLGTAHSLGQLDAASGSAVGAGAAALVPQSVSVGASLPLSAGPVMVAPSASLALGGAANAVPTGLTPALGNQSVAASASAPLVVGAVAVSPSAAVALGGGGASVSAGATAASATAYPTHGSTALVLNTPVLGATSATLANLATPTALNASLVNSSIGGVMASPNACIAALRRRC